MKVAKWFTKHYTLAQTFDTGIQYAFLSADNEQCFPLVTCKEFLIDAVHALIHNKPTFLYGFTYSIANNPPICLDPCRLLLSTNSKKNKATFYEDAVRLKSFLNLLEQKMGCENESEIEVVENHPPLPYIKQPMVLLTSPALWMLSPPMLSLFALLIRVGFYYNGKETAWGHCQKVRDKKIITDHPRNGEYLKSAWKTIMDLVESGGMCRFKPDMKDNWPLFAQQWQLHEWSGIVSLAKGTTKNLCPQWYPKSTS
jgi:hypothetical protein